jgi:peptide deformylase
MKHFKVLKHPNPKLKQVAEPVETFNEELKNTVLRMINTVKKEGGIGLAGNQVGVLQRIIIIDTLKADKSRGFFGALINPTIVSKALDKTVYPEGCLSFPNAQYWVERNNAIVVKFQNVMGAVQEREFKGITSICIQHEIDHLNGVTFDTKAQILL